ncbi:MAG: tyrosine-type recombinase/integrase [Pseudomonadota bacterium]|jgi:integrase|nr:tyrosine-type recombinase/integrase [Pseudomonadota bacterium]
MPITHVAIVNAKPREKPYRLFDGRGLYLEVSPSGGRWWRFKYRFNGKEKRLSLGVYPDVSLKEAREHLDDVRRKLKDGIDPAEERKSKGATSEAPPPGDTFETVAREWFAKHSPAWAPGHGDKIIRRLELNIFPWLGAKPIPDIKPLELLGVVQRIEQRGANETAHRALQNCGRVFRYAVATGRAERDITRDLLGALAPVVERHHASIVEPKAVGALLRAIDGYDGSLVVRCALRLAPLVFVRPGELRMAEWDEFNLEEGEWRIPATRMKMRTPHFVPLSSQAVEILRELRPLTGDKRFVFPGERSRDRPMSNNTVNAALRRLGYSSDQMTGHGFRSMASTLLNEQGWHPDAIERQLAHQEPNEIRAAYNYAKHLPERRKMMQAWADYLYRLRASSGSNPSSGRRLGVRAQA